MEPRREHAVRRTGPRTLQRDSAQPWEQQEAETSVRRASDALCPRAGREGRSAPGTPLCGRQECPLQDEALRLRLPSCCGHSLSPCVSPLTSRQEGPPPATCSPGQASVGDTRRWE